MKKLSAFALLYISAMSASASCVAHDYEEMQAMSIEEPKGEYCKAAVQSGENLDRAASQP